MKTKTITISILFLFASPIFADSLIQQQFELASEARQQALAEAAIPINRKYLSYLEQLLRRATQNNELDVAIKIKAAIDDLKITTTKDSLYIYVGSWMLVDGDYKDVRKLYKNGKWGGQQGPADGTWTVDEKYLTLHYANGRSEPFTLPMKDNSLTGTNMYGDHLTLTKIRK